MALYGIINLAAAVPLRSTVMRLEPPDGEPLLGRKAFADTLAVGPWLVDLDRVPGIVREWKKVGQWQDWGYTFLSTLELADLVRHFKKFNRVTLEGHEKPVLFRYFDVVVFLDFMANVATEEQADAIFQGIAQFNVEDKTTKQIFVIKPN